MSSDDKRPLREKLEVIFADAMARYHGEHYVAAIVAGRVSGDVSDPSLTPLQQLIDDVQRVVDEVDRHQDKTYQSAYSHSDLLNSVERTQRAINGWREIIQYARQEERGGLPTGG